MSRSSTPPRSRVQLDLRPEQIHLLELLEQKLALRSRSDLIQEAIGTLVWLVQETMRGRKVVSIAAEEADRLGHVVEFVSPALAFATGDIYEHLVSRPESNQRQRWLKGRNMTVGQLIATMRANKLSPEEASDELELPREQIREALIYYETHQELVDSELREQRIWLENRGYAVEPPAVPR